MQAMRHLARSFELLSLSTKTRCRRGVQVEWETRPSSNHLIPVMHLLGAYLMNDYNDELVPA